MKNHEVITYSDDIKKLTKDAYEEGSSDSKLALHSFKDSKSNKKMQAVLKEGISSSKNRESAVQDVGGRGGSYTF